MLAYAKTRLLFEWHCQCFSLILMEASLMFGCFILLTTIHTYEHTHNSPIRTFGQREYSMNTEYKNRFSMP